MARRARVMVMSIMLVVAFGVCVLFGLEVGLC